MFVSTAKLKELPNKFKEIQKESESLKASPAGLLFQQARKGR